MMTSSPPPGSEKPTWIASKLLKLDASGEMILAESDLVLKIQSLSVEEKCKLLPTVVGEMIKAIGENLTALHLEKALNVVKGKTVKPEIPVLATGKIKKQEVFNPSTGVIQQGYLMVELQDLVKFGKVGLHTNIMNLSIEDKANLLLLLERELECSVNEGEGSIENAPK